MDSLRHMVSKLLVGVCSKLNQFMLAPQRRGSSTGVPAYGEVETNACCRSCKRRTPWSSTKENIVSACERDLSSDDAEMVMQKLGLWSPEEELDGDGGRSDGRCEDCRLLDGAFRLLEEKEASLGELEVAFAVFDENGDGLISAMELRSVMWRLGFQEGMRMEDCERMIMAYDVDGDGKIGFNEFKAMLEYAM